MRQLKFFQHNMGSTIKAPGSRFANTSNAEFNHYVNTNSLQVLLLQDISISFRPPYGFKVFGLPDRSCAVLTHSQIETAPVPALTVSTEAFSAVVVKVMLADQQTILHVASVYRKDRHSDRSTRYLCASWLEKVLTTLHGANLVVGGDFNLRHPRLGCCPSGRPCPAGEPYFKSSMIILR